jgi:hypothetical protein
VEVAYASAPGSTSKSRSFGEVCEVRVAAVGDHRREERSIGQLERQHRRLVVRSKGLQLWHGLTLSV